MNIIELTRFGSTLLMAVGTNPVVGLMFFQLICSNKQVSRSARSALSLLAPLDYLEHLSHLLLQ